MIKVFFDGAFEISSGTLGTGCIIERDGVEIYGQHYKAKVGSVIQLKGVDHKLSETSNNVSEYLSIISAMEYLISENLHKTSGITFYGDSALVINQLAGKWQAKEGAYKPYAKYAKELAWKFRSPIFTWIPRNENSRCDALSRTTL